MPYSLPRCTTFIDAPWYIVSHPTGWRGHLECLPLLEVPAIPWHSRAASSLRISVVVSSSPPLVASRVLPSAPGLVSSLSVAMIAVDGTGFLVS